MNRPIAVVSLSLVAAFASCTGLSTAPTGSPRVETEVVVNMDPSFTRKLPAAGADLTRAIVALVMSRADLGLRFYPVLSSSYGPKDPRPEYLLTVDVADLDVAVERPMTQTAGSPPVAGTPFVRQIDCVVTTTVAKRRTTGPALTVGRSTGRGTVTATTTTAEGADRTTYTLPKTDDQQPALTVLHVDLMKATEMGLKMALTELVKPVDREFAPRAAASGTSSAATPR
jgi:hypothetical protein